MVVLLPRLLPVIVKISPFYHFTVLDQDGFDVKVVVHGSNLNLSGSDELQLVTQLDDPCYS